MDLPVKREKVSLLEIIFYRDLMERFRTWNVEEFQDIFYTEYSCNKKIVRKKGCPERKVSCKGRAIGYTSITRNIVHLQKINSV